MRKLFIILGTISILTIGGIIWSRFLRQEEKPFLPIQSGIHFYNDPAIGLDEIKIKAFYVVPANKQELAYPQWKEALEKALADAVRFHALQFRGKSKLRFEIFPEPIILEQENLFYDTFTTQRGNPEALKNIYTEIERRVFAGGGDLWREPFSLRPLSEFTVSVFIYEGVGASGTEGALILSRSFLSEEEYAAVRSSLFYHEFGHTMGFPDQYDLETNSATSEDIMGFGRNRSIEDTYLDRYLTAGMGLKE